MTGSTHFIAGLLIGEYIAIKSASSIEETVMLMILSAFASLLPDIDHPTSTISELLKPISVAYNWLERKLMPSGMQHRGFTHTTIIPIGMLLYWYFNSSVLVLALAGGYMSHIALDAVTTAGIPIFYPLTRKRIGLGFIKTGSNGEYRIRSVMWIGLLIYCSSIII